MKSRAMKDVTSEEPPYEMKGNVTPVSGNRRRFPPMIRIAWTPKYAVTPAASSLRKVPGARREARSPRTMIKPKVARRSRPRSAQQELLDRLAQLPDADI